MSRSAQRQTVRSLGVAIFGLAESADDHLGLSLWREDMREDMAEWLDKTAPRG